jgi:Rrf2 family nitric oxide-sensitive transcriptional repressor
MIKVIHRLGMGGFIETVRGRNGGVRLGRAPETILIGAVVRYMEEDLSLLACMEPDGASKADLCTLMPGCRLRGVLSQAMGAMLGVLDQYTLADVITPHERRRLTEEAG